jgi:pimeloyl-ACP methyl ester carboxylesterase
MIVGGIELELLRRGHGAKKLLLLHGFDPVPPQARFLDRLAPHYEIIAPSCPGFGNSPRSDDFATMYDLVHLHLELLDSLGEPVTLVGFSFGGWLAAEMAAASCHRIEKLVLVDPLGLKIGGRETPDILDLFNTHPRVVTARRWRDPARFAPDFNAMSDDELVRLARNREALCLYGWQPYLHNPRLTRWLARIKIPTLVLWGAQDGVVAPAYGRAYADLIPGARFELIDEAGHHPEIEQPDAFADRLLAFLES